mgnify:CR=1 FL=1
MVSLNDIAKKWESVESFYKGIVPHNGEQCGLVVSA